MASLYKRAGSPFWWLKWRNPATGKIEQLSTECLVGDGRDRVKAIQLRNEHSTKEGRASVGIRRHPFRDWVEDYLTTTHAQVPRTLQRYLSSWKLVATYLDSKDVSAPGQVNRAICLGYVAWRRKLRHLNKRGPGGKKVSANTILLEVKVLSKIMQESVAREIIEYNPCLKLGLRRDPSRVKDEMTDDHIRIIRAEIARRRAAAETQKEKETADCLNVSFEIARMQGIRLSETWLPMDDIDLGRRLITLRGKGNKLEDINMNPGLVPLFEELKRQKRTHTFVMPKMISLVWFKLFDAVRRKHPGFAKISYHSTRVTVITRMERSGVPENVMMKAVLHSSTTVHRVYRRVQAQELAAHWPSLDLDAKGPAGAASPSGNPAASGTPDSTPTSPTRTAPSSSDHKEI